MKGRIRPSARCRALLLELSRYLDDDLTPTRRLAVERHINACTCCGTMAARLRMTLAVCRAEGKNRPPRDVMSRAAARIRSLITGETHQAIAITPSRYRLRLRGPRVR
jgi:anti-sigma factor RsiW